MTDPRDLLQALGQVLDHAKRQARVIRHLLDTMDQDGRLSEAARDDYRRQLVTADTEYARIDALVTTLWRQLSDDDPPRRWH